MIRRYGKVPEKGRRYEIRHGAYGILERNGSLLLTWQGGIHNEVQLPGGGIDPGESAIAALHREVFEETGWRIATPQKLGVYRRFTFMPEYEKWAEKVCHIYLARPVLRLGPPVEVDHTAIWTSPSQAIRVLTNDGDADFVSAVYG